MDRSPKQIPKVLVVVSFDSGFSNDTTTKVLYSQKYFALVGYPTFLARLHPQATDRMHDSRKNTNTIKQFLLADNSGPVRNFLRQFILSNDGWRVCAEAEDGLAAVDQTESLRPDCAILDFAMPRLNGIEAASLIARRSPGTAVLLISMHEEHVLARHLTAEIRGFVAKSRLGLELLPAIRAVLGGGKYFVSCGDGNGATRPGL